jgi:hypothetical protein
MSTTPRKPEEFDWQQLGRLMCQDRNISSGYWRVGVKIAFSATTVDWQRPGNGTMPTAMVGMGGLALLPEEGPGPMVFDASKLTKRRTARKEIQHRP